MSQSMQIKATMKIEGIRVKGQRAKGMWGGVSWEELMGGVVCKKLVRELGGGWHYDE